MAEAEAALRGFDRSGLVPGEARLLDDPKSIELFVNDLAFALGRFRQRVCPGADGASTAAFVRTFVSLKLAYRAAWLSSYQRDLAALIRRGADAQEVERLAGDFDGLWHERMRRAMREFAAAHLAGLDRASFEYLETLPFRGD